MLSGADDPDGAFSLFFDEETRRATQNQIEKEMIKRRRVKLAKLKGIKLDPSEFIDEKDQLMKVVEQSVKCLMFKHGVDKG